jgi:hypothetical protein
MTMNHAKILIFFYIQCYLKVFQGDLPFQSRLNTFFNDFKNIFFILVQYTQGTKFF